MADKTRKLRLMGTFQKDLERLRPKVTRLDDFVRGAEEALCRDPLLGNATAESFLFALPMKQLPGNPGIVLYYAYSETEVIFVFLGSDRDSRPSSIIM